jgi:hypothetical protein
MMICVLHIFFHLFSVSSFIFPQRQKIYRCLACAGGKARVYRHVGILKDGKYTVKKESWRQLRHRHIDRDCLQLFLQCAATQGC